MDEAGLGREFRALRVAAGRTVASVAVDAGLSVPYIANLENGRGNPTIGALRRLAAALGRPLVVGLASGQGDRDELDNSKKPAAVMPPSLIRFTRTQRFRRAAAAMALAADERRPGGGDAGDDAEFAARLVTGLAGLAGALGRDLSEGDWNRLLDALLLVIVHPHGD